MTLEEILAHITSFGWFTRLVEINSTHREGDPPRTWADHAFRLDDGSIAPRTWWADLHHPSAVKKHGYGPTPLAALERAWNSEEVERESLYLQHPIADDAPKLDLASLGVVPARPILRRI